MDETEGLGGEYGRDSKNDQFHRNEAISAVADDGFLGEEDDDYEDLYNDVNVGENFLHSLQKNEDNMGQKIDQMPESRPNSTPLPPPPQQEVTGSVGVGLQDEGGYSRVHTGSEGYQNLGFGGNSVTNEVGVGRGIGGPSGGGGGGGLRVEFGQSTNKVADMEERTVSNNLINNQQMTVHHQPHATNMEGTENLRIPGNVNMAGGNMFAGDGSGGGGTVLFVGDLHWWTTDAELELELSKYGPVKEVKFFDERASGKSKGYCQVEFYDPLAASACKEGMNGHIFNGRACVVAFASPFTVKRMGEAQMNRIQQTGQTAVTQSRRGPVDMPSRPNGGGGNVAPSGNNQGGVGGGDSNGRGFGRGNWGRGNSQGGMGGRGTFGPMRGRAGGMGVRGLAGNGNGFGSAPPMMHPQAMMVHGFDPAFGGPMGRMGSYGGFPGGPAAPFAGVMSSFGPVGNVGLPGVAPHVNPAFFGRGMPLNGMGMMPNPGAGGPNMLMWSDPNLGNWAGEEHGGRGRESSYGEEAASDHQYGEGSQERGPWPNASKEKDRGSERDWSESSERRYRDEKGAGYERDAPREKDVSREHDWSERRHRDDRDSGRDKERERDRSQDRDRERERERDRNRDERERHADHHRYRSREAEHDDEWDRGKSSRAHGRSKLSHEEEQRSRSRDAEYGKRRRLASE